MAKGFSFGDINLNQSQENKNISNDEANYALSVSEDIIDIFAKHNTEIEDAYLILTSLADAIYMYVATRE